MKTLNQNQAIEDMFSMLDHFEAAISGTRNQYLNQMIAAAQQFRTQLTIIEENEESDNEIVNQFDRSDEIDLGTRLKIVDAKLDCILLNDDLI